MGDAADVQVEGQALPSGGEVSREGKQMEVKVAAPHSESAKVPFGELAPETETYRLDNFIPEELKDKPYIKNLKDFPDLFNQFSNAQELLGKRPNDIPDSQSTPEDWDKFYNKVGRPEHAEEYKFNADALPEGAS